MDILVSLLIVLAIFGIIWWAISKMGLPQPAMVIAVVVMAIVAIGMLTGAIPLPHLNLH